VHAPADTKFFTTVLIPVMFIGTLCELVRDRVTSEYPALLFEYNCTKLHVGPAKLVHCEGMATTGADDKKRIMLTEIPRSKNRKL